MIAACGTLANGAIVLLWHYLNTYGTLHALFWVFVCVSACAMFLIDDHKVYRDCEERFQPYNN